MYLGIDLGTSSVKVLLMDEQQQVLASHSESLTVSRPQPLWSEQDPEQWWQATQQAMRQLQQLQPQLLSQVKAISFSGQMHGAVLLDAQGQVLRPAILWNDGRSAAQCQQLLTREPQAIAITGNLIMSGFTAPKLLWVKEHEADIFHKIDKVLLPKDYLRYRMGGHFATDMSDASGTSWLSVKERCWSEAMLSATGLSEKHMPKLYEGNAVTGELLPELAKVWGLSSSVVLVAGGGDNAASAISIGVIKQGSAFLSLGTSGVLFVADQACHPNPQQAVHSYCHCLPNRWHQMAVHLSAASCLQWLAMLLKEKNITTLLDQVQQHDNADIPLFLPYLSGERTPHNDPYARGVFFGMTHETSRLDLVQSVLEGVAFAFAQGQEAIQQAGMEIKNIAVVGGGARSHYWGEILAAALQQPLNYHQAADMGGAYGAARLAWLAIHDGADPEASLPAPPLMHTISVDSVRAERYQQRQQQFNQLYQQLQPCFADIYQSKP